MSSDNIFTPNFRKELIKNICYKLHEDGIKSLKKIGDLSKTTGLYHYTIRDPSYLPKEPFLFVTELFGNEEALPSNKTLHFSGMTRLQYHGNFDGVQRIIQQMITPGMSLPAHIILADKNNITDAQRERFDRAWTYLEETVRHNVPANKVYLDRTEFITHTYFI